jgi:hypothetical protein
VHLYSQKKFQLSSSLKIILVKNVFYAHYQISRKVFSTLLWKLYFINKKVAQVPLYLPKIN